MRIIGGKDYYDSALAFGQEATGALFKRSRYQMDSFAGVDPHPDPEFFPDILLEGAPDVDFHRLDEPAYGDHSHLGTIIPIISKRSKLTLNPVIVWFCGKRYAGLRVQKDNSEREFGDHGHVFWNAKALLDHIDAKNIQKKPIPKASKKGATSRENITRFFETKDNPRVHAFLIENHISVAVWDPHLASNTWIINGDVLKYVQFQKVFPPFQAMQELSMFIDGILPANTTPIVEITDDKVKIAKHGFDEWTFRKKSEKITK